MHGRNGRAMFEGFIIVLVNVVAHVVLFLFAASVLLAIEWLANRSRHFSVHDLLVALTIVCVFLGAVAFAVK
jgi:hypothetical protein